MRNFTYIYWAVKHKKYQEEINIGDKVFIWRSKGKSKDPYGVVAFGSVAETPIHKNNVKFPKFLIEEYWKKREVSPVKVGIQLESSRLDLENGLIDSSLLMSDEVLSKMQLLTVKQGTNFKLTESQFKKIYKLWNSENSDPEENEYETEEGKAKLRLHKVRERNNTLVKKAKDSFLAKNGTLYCEACDFSFTKIYENDYIDHMSDILFLKMMGN